MFETLKTCQKKGKEYGLAGLGKGGELSFLFIPVLLFLKKRMHVDYLLLL